jgi:hypothetical protein
MDRSDQESHVLRHFDEVHAVKGPVDRSTLYYVADHDREYVVRKRSEEYRTYCQISIRVEYVRNVE